jgi:tetratricopeptide (TPR) repeat protein
LLSGAALLLEEADPPRALALYQRALNLYRELGDNDGLGPILAAFGSLHVKLSRSTEADLALSEAEQLLRRASGYKALAGVLSDLGAVAADAAAAQCHYARGLDLARQYGDEAYASRFQAALRRLEGDGGEQDSASTPVRET